MHRPSKSARKSAKAEEPYLSGYRIMWMMVLFDLPVITKREKKDAAEFRKCLLNRGFFMAQYSVYYKVLPGKEAIEALENSLKNDMPKRGKVEIVCITDRQYEEIRCFEGGGQCNQRKNPEQLQLF